MKYILFVVLLFGASCYSESVQNQGLASADNKNNSTPKVTEASVVINDSPHSIPGTVYADDNNGTTKVEPITTVHPTSSSSPKPTSTPPTPTTKPTTTTTAKSTTTTTTTTHSPTTSTSSTTPSSPGTKPTPTIPSSSSSPTVRPQPTGAPTTSSPTHHRGFDGPSFIGGIILASGMVAIGFVAFKFYKARTEMNYHTL